MNKCHSSQFRKLFLTQLFLTIFSSILLQKYFWLKEWGRSIYKKASWVNIDVGDEKQL